MKINEETDKKILELNEDIIKTNQKLRDTYFIYNDMRTRGQLRLERRIGSNGKHQYDFDLNAQEYFYRMQNHVYLDRPETQDQFNQIVSSMITSEMKSSNDTFQADEVAHKLKKILYAKNSPIQMKETIAKYFKRLIANLKMKKVKTIQRLTAYPDLQRVKPEEYIRSRINLIDFEMISLQSRRDRLKLDEQFEQSFQTIGSRPKHSTPSQNTNTNVKNDDDELCFSNISKDDLDVYLRSTLFNSKCSRPMMKLLKEIDYLHLLQRNQIMSNANDTMNSRKLKNIERNLATYHLMQDYFEKFAYEKYQQTPEIRLTLIELTESLKFKFDEDQEFNSLRNRYDVLPLLPMFEMDSIKVFQESCIQFLKPENLSSIKTETQQWIYRVNKQQKFCSSTISQVQFFPNKSNQVSIFYLKRIKQKKISIFLFQQNSDQELIVKSFNKRDSTRISDLTLNEENILKDYLKNPLIVLDQPQLIKQDWCFIIIINVLYRLSLLDFKPQLDTMHILTKEMISDVPLDIQVRIVHQLCQMNDEEAMRKYIAQNVEDIVKKSYNQLFTVMENKKFVESTHLQISLDLLNELFDQSKKEQTEIIYKCKQKIKPDHLRIIEDAFLQHKPNPGVLETAFTLDVLGTREHRIQVLKLLNAIRSFERRITFDCIMVMDCKIQRDLDMDMILSVAEQREHKEKVVINTKIENFLPQETKPKLNLQRRKALISFVETRRGMDQNFIAELRSDLSVGRWDKVDFKHFEVISTLGEGTSESSILYDVSLQDLTSVTERLEQTASFFINKYEKINRVQQGLGLIVNRYALLKDLWAHEYEYQLAKLKLINQLMVLYDNLTDPLEIYKIAVKVLNLKSESPIIDPNSVNFYDCYELCTSLLQKEQQILIKLTDLQSREEQNEVKRYVRKFGALQRAENFKDEPNPSVTSNTSKNLNTNPNLNTQTFDAIKDEDDDLYANDILDPYILEKEMDQVFEEIGKDRIEQTHDDQLLQNQKSSQHLHKFGYFLLHPEKQVKIRFEGFPHQLYGDLNSHPVDRTFDNIFDFYNSLGVARLAYSQVLLGFDKLLNDLPQKSPTMLLCMKEAYLDSAYKLIINHKDQPIGSLEERELFDDPVSLSFQFHEFSEEIFQLLKEYQYRETIFQQKDLTDTRSKDLLILLDQQTLDSVLFSRKAIYQNQYRGLFLMCNLVEFLRLREELILTIQESKVVNRLYKSQRALLGIKSRKYEELSSKECGKYILNQNFFASFKHNFHFASADGDDSKKIKTKNLKCAFITEVDSSYSLTFTSQNDVLIYSLPDMLEEMRTILFYESCSLETTLWNTILWETRLGKINHMIMELDQLQRNKVIVEVGYLDTDRIFLTKENFKKLKKNIESIGYNGSFEQFTEKPKDCKSPFIKLAESKFHEAHQMLMASNKSNQSLPNIIICQKRLRKLVSLDLVRDCCIEASKYQLIQVCRETARLAQVIPNHNKIFTIQCNTISEELEKFIYVEQKKNLLKSNSLQSNSGRQNKFLIDQHGGVLNPFYILSADEIIRYSKEKLNDEAACISLKSHITRVDVISVGYMQAFYNLNDRLPLPSKNLNLNQEPKGPQTEYSAIEYLEQLNNKLTGKRGSIKPKFLSIDSDRYAHGKVIKYYMQLSKFLYYQLLRVCTTLEQREAHALINTIATAQPLDDDIHPDDLKYGDIEAREHNRVLMNYEQRAIDLEPSSQKQVVLHNVIDSLVERIKRNIQLKDQMVPIVNLLNNINKQTLDEMHQIEELGKFFRDKASWTYKLLLLGINEATQGNYERQDNLIVEQTKSCFLTQNLYTTLLNDFRENPLKLKHFNTTFYNLGAEKSLKIPQNRLSEFKRFQHKSFKALEQIQQLIRYFPGSFQKFLFELSPKLDIQQHLQKQEDYKLSQNGVWFNKPVVLVNRTPISSKFLEAAQKLCQIGQAERRMMSSYMRLKEDQCQSFISAKLRTNNLNQFESSTLENDFLLQHTQVLQTRYAKMFITYKVDLPLISFEILRYMQDIKNEVERNSIQIRKSYHRMGEMVSKVLPKNDQKLLEIETVNKEVILATPYMSELIDKMIEKELFMKQIYTYLNNQSINVMQEEIEIMSTFKQQQQQNTKEIPQSKLGLNRRFHKPTHGLVNQNIILPRQKNNPCFSSSLLRNINKNSLPTGAKISFLQAFVNRIRNKVSRVELLSSGQGFVITVNDFEDCINYLHRSLYQFGEKELATRLETCALIFDMQQHTINSKNKEIAALKIQNKQLQETLDKHVDSMIIQKGNQLLYDYDAIKRKLSDFTIFTSGLEDHLREQISKDFNTANEKILNEHHNFMQRLNDFRRELFVLCKTEIQQHQTDMLQFIKDRSNDALQGNDEQHTETRSSNAATLLQHRLNKRSSSLLIQEPSHKKIPSSRCNDDEDVLLDPYVTTKYINKLRLFYMLKIGAIREKTAKEIKKYEEKIESSQEISQKIRDYQQRESILRKELVNLHDTINNLQKLFEKVQNENENLQFDKKRLQKICQDQQAQIKSLTQSIDRTRNESINPATKRFMSTDSKPETLSQFPKIPAPRQVDQTNKFKIKNLQISLLENDSKLQK